jgi:PAS domain S-box-containing protein
MNENPLILIAEDDPILAAHLEDTIVHFGYRIAGMAATGKKTVELALSKNPDMILMDIRLRGEINGIQAAEEIHKTSDIPIVYLAEYNDEAVLQMARVSNAYAYLTKPMRDRELRASLEMTLIKHAAERRLNHLNRVLKAIRDINQLILHEADPQRLLEGACQVLVNTRGYAMAWIGQTAAEDMDIHPIACAGEHTSYLNEIKITRDTSETGLGPTGTAVRTRQAVAAHNLATTPNYNPWRESARKHGFATSAAVPMINTEKFYGVLTVYADHVNVFDDEEMDLLKELANDLAFGLKALEEEAARRQAENALRESEDKFKFIFDYANIGKSIIFLSEEIQVNKAFCDLLGYEPEELQHRRWQEITHPDDVDSTRAAYRALIAGEKEAQRHVKRVLNKNGPVIWVEESTILRRDGQGKPLYLVATVSDISRFMQQSA